MNYEAMNAFELVCAIETLGQREGTSRDMPWPDSLPALMSILRRRVIQEASVGAVAVKTESRDGYPYVDKLTMKEAMPHGWMVYDLIPKETT